MFTRHATEASAMRSLTALLCLLLLPLGAVAAVYRCEDHGRVTYQDQPCPEGSRGRAVDTADPASFPAPDPTALAAQRERRRDDEQARRDAATSTALLESQARLLQAQRQQAEALAALTDEVRNQQPTQWTGGGYSYGSAVPNRHRGRGNDRQTFDAPPDRFNDPILRPRPAPTSPTSLAIERSIANQFAPPRPQPRPQPR
jgi:hypothetical protein